MRVFQMGLINFMTFAVPKEMWSLVLISLLCFQITAKVSKIKKSTQGDLNLTFYALSVYINILMWNVSCTRYNMLLLAEKHSLNKTRLLAHGFYHGPTGYFIVYINYIIALTFTTKSPSSNFLLTVAWKRGLGKPYF